MKKLLTALLCLLALAARAQDHPRLGDGLYYWAMARGSLSSGTYAPFWFTANQHGLSTPNTNSGLLDVGVSTFHPRRFLENNDDWRLGYGLEVATPFGMDSHVVLQQLYGELQWKHYLRLCLGQKERWSEVGSGPSMSTGGLTTGTNARPLPEVRLETPGFIPIPGTKGWLGIHARMAFGWFTDNGWQRQFTSGSTTKYTANSRYHTKALFFEIGNWDNKFPFVANFGMEMSTQFGGEAWNLMRSLNSEGGGTYYNEKIASGPKAYWHALIPGGSDSNDGAFGNRSGNHLGSWHASLFWKGNDTGWNASVYMEHFFEDQSQMFLQYPWRDMLVGVHIGLPREVFRNIITDATYEYLGTKDQSGPVYHDATPTLPEQISAVDEYYNNHIYGAWQHAGFVMGNPLLLSPIYNLFGRNEIYVYHNRIKAHHVGLRGEPSSFLSWRVLYTHEKSWGTYQRPLVDPQLGNFLLAEVTCKPFIGTGIRAKSLRGQKTLKALRGLSVSLAYGHNSGKLLGRSNGAMLTIAYLNSFDKRFER